MQSWYFVSFREADFFFLFFKPGEFPERYVFARISRIDQIGSGSLSRSVIEFDTVSASGGKVVAGWIRNGTAESFDEFGLLRVTTTPNKFAELALDITDPQPGFWYLLKLDPKHSGDGMRAWFAGPTEFGFSAISKGRIVEARRFVSSIDPAPRPASLGASQVPARTLPAAIAAACRVPSRISRISAQDVLARVPQCDKVLVHDVGQASFTTLLKDEQPCLHAYSDEAGH